MLETEPFEGIAQFVGSHQNFSASSHDCKLDFYALYKSANGTAPSFSFPRRLYLYCFAQVEYQKWLRWWLWSHQEGLQTADHKRRYCVLAAQIGAYPSAAELRIMQSASTRGKGSSMMVGEDAVVDHSSLDELIDACRDENVAFIEAYLATGGDVNIKNEEGTSLLHFAVDANAADIVRVLLQHGANIDAVDDEGLTPCKSAELNGQEYSHLVELMQGHQNVHAQTEE